MASATNINAGVNHFRSKKTNYICQLKKSQVLKNEWDQKQDKRKHKEWKKKSEKEKQTNEIKKFQKFLHWKLDSTTLTTVVQLHGLSNLSLSSSLAS